MKIYLHNITPSSPSYKIAQLGNKFNSVVFYQNGNTLFIPISFLNQKFVDKHAQAVITNIRLKKY